ncbi:MAG: hypothetical protein ACXWQO_18660 [Bdellovibrionota bacterium]
MKQHSLFPKPSLSHGGALARGRRKTLRPLARKRPIHLVLKAQRAFSADGTLLLKETRRLAEKFGLRLYDRALGNDHLHLVLTIPGRREYNAFIRSLTGLLARKMGQGIWALLPFTRVAQWGKQYKALAKYLEQNRLETAGVMPYQPRRESYPARRSG